MSNEHSRTQSVLEARAPSFNSADAERIASEHFSVSASAHPLESERDQNFRLRARDGGDWVLKISNPAEDPAILDFQTQALLHIERVAPDFPVPRVRLSTKGAPVQPIVDAQGRRFMARLLSFLPGQVLDDAPQDDAMLRSVGATAALLGHALRGFFHPAARHELLWDLCQAPALHERTLHIEDTVGRELVSNVFDRFEQHVLPDLARMRAQVIHNDVSTQNTLVEDGRVVAVIDFGDLIHAPLVCDIAVPLSELIQDHDDPTHVATQIVAGYHAIEPFTEEEIGTVRDLVLTRLAMSVTVSAWRSIDHPENIEYITAGIPSCWNTLEWLSEEPPGGFDAALRDACDLPGADSTARIVSHPRADGVPAEIDATGDDSVESLLERRLRVLGPGLSLFYDPPLHIVKGRGVTLIDASGNTYLDAYNNVPQVGHCHPVVVEALSRQAATLNTNTRYLYTSVLDYAERLADLMPGTLEVCMFVCSGSEANDLAWRLATAHTGNTGAIVIEDAYHGTTEAVSHLSPNDLPDGAAPADHVATIPAPDVYRGRYRRDQADCAERYAECLDDAIAELRDRGHAPAAFYLDLVLSSSGIIVPPSGYLDSAIAKVRAAGGLFVADEVQSGFGRTGSHFWGFEEHGVIPDIVTLGKPIGNGLSMAALVTTPEIVRSFIGDGEFFSTTGGNPVSCAAGLAVLDVLEGERLMQNAERVGAQLRRSIESLAEQHPLIGDVRGAGLFIGVELVRDRTSLEPATQETRSVANKMRDAGVLVGIDGPHANVLKIRPPLVFSEIDAKRLIEALQTALGSI